MLVSQNLQTRHAAIKPAEPSRRLETRPRTVELAGSDIPVAGGMTVRAVMAPEPPPRVWVPWSISWDPILGRSLPLVIGVLVLAGIGVVVGFVWARRSDEDEPGLPVMYAPPEGLGPAQTVYITKETAGTNALSATLFYLADKKLVTLELRDDKSWLVTGTGTPEQWAAIDAPTMGVAQSVGVSAPGYWFLADRSKSSGEVLQGAKTGLESASATWAKDAGYVAPSKSESTGRMLWVFAFILAIAGFSGWGGPTMYGLVFAGFVIGGMGLMKAGIGTRRTFAGRQVWSKSGGFERLLSTPSSEDRFDFAAQKDLFISFIPFAVAFGVADKWAEKYRIYTHTEPPLPFWYPYGYGMYGDPYSMGGSFGDFDTAVSASISAYQASQSSSSSGGGGMGGGGGGGGGGSW